MLTPDSGSFLGMCALIVLATFGTRYLPAAFYRDIPASDEGYHQYYIDAIKRNGHRIPDTHGRILPERKTGYPYLLHWALSYVPERWIKRTSPYFGAIVDSVHAVVVMGIFYWLVGGTESPFGSLPVVSVLLAGLVFATTPKLVSGAPMTSRLQLSARAMGNLLVSCATLSLIAWSITGDSVYVLVSVIFVVAAYLTSLFSTQVLWFLYPFVAVWIHDPTPILILAFSFVLAVVVSRGKYLHIFRSHVGTLWWAWSAQVSEVLDSSSIADLTEVPGSPPEALKYLYRHPVCNVYIQTPFLLVFIYLYYTYPLPGSEILTAWLVFGIVINLVIAIPGVPAKPAHRYAEYVVAPLAIYLSVAIYSFDVRLLNTAVAGFDAVSLGLVVLFSYSLLLGVFNSYVDAAIRRTPGTREVIEKLRATPQATTVYPLPSPLGKRLLGVTEHTYIVPSMDLFATKQSRQKSSDVFGRYGELPNVEIILEELEPEYVLVDRRQEKFQQLVSRIDEEKFSIALENESYTMYERK